MLQQTRVETVIPYYERFLARFPTPLALAEAPEDDVLAAWSGLGYYRRARLLHAGAKEVARRSDMPTDRAGLLALPGIGRYTAGAIASIAFGEEVGLVDGNVARVFARLFAIEDGAERKGARRLEVLADALVDAGRPGDFNQALMELGATTCTPRAPACDRCPVATTCKARAEGRVHELPRTAPAPAKATERVQAIVAGRVGRILIARRRSGGLFGGLWEPPSIVGGARARGELARGLPLASIEPRGRVIHVLTHRRLTVDVHAAVLLADPDAAALPAVYETARLVDPARLEAEGIGIATLTRKILATAARA